MSQTTKRALAAALKKLLLEKPFHKITIGDITEDCGINRMTFYYHFKDIYDLVEWVCVEDAARALEGKKTYETWQEGFLNIFQAVQENKPFVVNVYRSVSQERIKQYLAPLIRSLILGVVEEINAGGPVGFGVLYIENGAKISRLISGGMQERGLRGGTSNTAAAVGCAAALEIAVNSAQANRAKVCALRDAFVGRVIAEIEGAHLNGGSEKLPSHANISFDGCDGENILFLLDMQGVAVSTGSACSAGAVTPSHVLLSMGLGESRAKSAVRFTFGKYNTAEEADKAFAALKYAVEKIRSAK